MNEVVTRAAALRTLIESRAADPAPQPLAEAVVSCCYELIYAGESDLALELIDSAAYMKEFSDPEWKLRFEIVRARALRAKGRFQESMALTLDLLANERGLLHSHVAESLELRISEAANLIQLNRADEASRN